MPSSSVPGVLGRVLFTQGSRRRPGRWLAGSTVAVGLILLTGCSSPAPAGQPSATPTSSAAPTSLTASVAPPVVANDLASGSAHHDLSVAGEPFALTVDYWTSGDPSAWSSLSTRSMNLSLHLVPVAGTTTPDVALSRSAVVTSLRSTDPGLDGLVVSATVDTAPASLPGYSMTVNFPYDQVAAVHGYSADLADRWTALAGSQPLTDDALVTAGVYANQVDYTYDLVVRNAGDPGYHKRTVTDTLTIPVAAAAAPQASGAGTPAPSAADGASVTDGATSAGGAPLTDGATPTEGATPTDAGATTG